MIYAFDRFEIDTSRVELRREGEPVPIEPRVFSLLCLLVENRDRVLSRDELLEKIWDGRFVSDAAISTSIHSARRALADDGAAPRFLKTVRGHGFRFVAEVRVEAPPGAPAQAAEGRTDLPGPHRSGRPTIAVLPFRLISDPGPWPAIADAIPVELISALSRLRWLSVIARGSSFRFRGVEATPAVEGLLGARYCLAGAVEVAGRTLSVFVDLIDAAESRVLWSERIHQPLDDLHALREALVRKVVTALELEIPLNEASPLRGKPSESLDAWGAYHLGLQHMYRFSRADNEAAAGLFRRAVTLDPHFVRAHAGLSFTSFQAAFLRYAADPAAEAALARGHAERAVELDPLDPMANFTLGRALWLEGTPDTGLPWLARATEVNPNFAQGFYARAWADIMAGRAAEGRANVDVAMRLSPIDPLLYAMQATRAITHLQRGELDEAALWADRAARAPGSHYLVAAIAVGVHEQAGLHEKAQAWAKSVRHRRPGMTRADFFQAFPFEDPETRETLSEALRRSGI
jgi:DNA-binding winged helix-turn-helix (wHTH) protein/tetratricopeptide (TPR) repeat protein